MSFPLLKASIKANWLLFVIFGTVLMMYLTIIISMFNPESMQAINEMLSFLPQSVTNMLGMSSMGGGLTSFIGSYYYGFLIIVFPMVYMIMVANRLICKLVDNGSMSYVLSTPNARWKVALTQAIYLQVSIILLFSLVYGVGIAICEAMFPGLLDHQAFLALNACFCMLSCAIGALCFLFSCLFNETKYSLALSAGVPIAFFLFKMISDIGPDYEWLGRLSPYAWADIARIISGEFNATGLTIGFLVATICLTGAGITLFSRRNLPL